MKPYIIVEQSLYKGDESLEQAVNRYISKGYELLGPPIPIESNSIQSLGQFKGLANTKTHYTYGQPMIMRHPTPKGEQ